jgi:hypothetical protein
MSNHQPLKMKVPCNDPKSTISVLKPLALGSLISRNPQVDRYNIDINDMSFGKEKHATKKSNQPFHGDLYTYIYNNRRKFRSQTSDNIERWKSRGGRSQRREDKKKED